MDVLKALLTSFGGSLGGVPPDLSAEEGSAERSQDGPTEAAIIAVVIGPVVALLVAIAVYSQLPR